MDNKVFIYIGFFLVVVYLISPVPYCKIVEKEICVEDAIYNSLEVSKNKNITVEI